MALHHLSWEPFKAPTDDISPVFFFWACRVLQGRQIEKCFPVSTIKKCLLIQRFLIFMVKIRHTLPKYPAPAPSSELISPKVGLELKLGCKTQPTFLEIHGCWHRFSARSSFFPPHIGQFRAVEKCFAGCIYFALLSNCFCNPKSPYQSKVVLFIQRSKSSVWCNSMLSLRDLLRRLIFITHPLPENHEGCRLKPS